MAAIRRALEEEFDAVREEGHACEAEMEECVGGAYGPDDDVDAQRLSSGMDQLYRYSYEYHERWRARAARSKVDSRGVAKPCVRFERDPGGSRRLASS